MTHAFPTRRSSDLLNGRMKTQDILDLFRAEVFATPDDEIFQPPADDNAAFWPSANEIAGMKIAIPVDRLHRFLPIGLPKEHRRPPRQDFSLFSRCALAAVSHPKPHLRL